MFMFHCLFLSSFLRVREMVHMGEQLLVLTGQWQ
jgi:hypothetical protein